MIMLLGRMLPIYLKQPALDLFEEVKPTSTVGSLGILSLVFMKTSLLTWVTFSDVTPDGLILCYLSSAWFAFRFSFAKRCRLSLVG